METQYQQFRAEFYFWLLRLELFDDPADVGRNITAAQVNGDNNVESSSVRAGINGGSRPGVQSSNAT